VIERQSSSSTTKNDRTSSKKKKSHKNEDSKKKKSKERDRSHHQVISEFISNYYLFFSLPRRMKLQIKKVVHHQKIIDENKMKNILPNLLVIIHLQQLLYPITNDDHHQTMLIL
jgi:hypothetical protein